MKKTVRHLARILVLLWVALIGLGMPRSLLAEPLPIAVFYPEIREPYRSIFLEILRGIEAKLSKPLYIYAIDKNFNLEKIKEKLEEDRVEVVIALGSRGLLLARALQTWFKVVVGAVLMVPHDEGLSGISLTPDPDRLFQKLKALLPEIKTVTVIYGEGHSERLIERAREAAKAYNLELNALSANSIQHAAILYRYVLSRLRSEKDAIWLLHGTAIDEQALLPLLLHQAWERNLVVFSSNLADVKRGALFTLYPDNAAMGRSLAELAIAQIESDNDSLSGIRPLRDLLGAINVRTAEHLGLNLPYWRLQEFELVFPSSITLGD